MAAPSWQDIYDLGKATAQVLRTELAVLIGDISDMLLSAATSMSDRVIGFGAEEFKKTYLDGASGDDLTTLVDDHWGIQRHAATQATGQIRLSRTSANGAPAGT